jgi:hypothetical protein
MYNGTVYEFFKLSMYRECENRDAKTKKQESCSGTGFDVPPAGGLMLFFLHFFTMGYGTLNTREPAETYLKHDEKRGPAISWQA